MSYFTRNMDKCSRLHSFPVTRYHIYIKNMIAHSPTFLFINQTWLASPCYSSSLCPHSLPCHVHPLVWAGDGGAGQLAVGGDGAEKGLHEVCKKIKVDLVFLFGLIKITRKVKGSLFRFEVQSLLQWKACSYLWFVRIGNKIYFLSEMAIMSVPLCISTHVCPVELPLRDDPGRLEHVSPGAKGDALARLAAGWKTINYIRYLLGGKKPRQRRLQKTDKQKN